MSDIIFVSNARLSFPNLVEPQKRVDQVSGETRLSYNCSLLILPNDPAYQQFMQRYAAMAQEKWKEHANQVMQMIHADRKSRCYAAGEECVNKNTFQPYDGYAGHVVINCGSRNAPQAIDGSGNPVDPANTLAVQQTLRKLYPGCRVNAAIKPWLQENKHGRGLRCDLIAIQFARDDAPFGAGAEDASGLFGAVAQPEVPAGFGGGAPAPQMPAAPFPGIGAPAAPGLPGLPPFMQQ